MRNVVLCLVFGVLAVSSAFAGPLPVSKNEAAVWERYLIPLPKLVEIEGKVPLVPAQVAVLPPAGQDKIINQACKELKEALGQPANMNIAGNPSFRIEMILGGSAADQFIGLKNSDQAYSIAPTANNDGLHLVALTPRGLYYASKTLQQLIRAKSGNGNVQIPLVNVIDWPDMEDRGLWGGDSGMLHVLLKLSEWKMNVVENISMRSVDKNGRGHSQPKDYQYPMLTDGYIRGIKPVPAVLHLEQVAGPYGDTNIGLFDIFPNLKAKDSEGGAICYSQPQFVDILADWMVDLKSLPNVDEVSVWLSENLHGKGGCKCEECKKTDRTLLEFRTILAAWEKAKKRVGYFGLRVLTSEETRASNALLFAEVPKGVKVWYYDSLYTYTTGKAPMVSKDVEDFAKNGGWVGVVPNLSAFVHYVEPFTAPQFTHYRMNEFVDKKMSGLLGYACMGLDNSAFIVEGSAEWAWNVKGRTPHEFALAWATRKGYKDPEKFADWVDVNEPVAWDVYGSDFPYSEKRNNPGPIAKLLRSGKLPPLGTVDGAFRGPWGQIKDVEQFDADLAAAKKSIQMARELGMDEYLYESMVVDSYIRALRVAYDLGQIMPDGKVPSEKKTEAERCFKLYISAMNDASDYLFKWRKALTGTEETDIASVDIINGSVNMMKQLAGDLKLDIE